MGGATQSSASEPREDELLSPRSPVSSTSDQDFSDDEIVESRSRSSSVKTAMRDSTSPPADRPVTRSDSVGDMFARKLSLDGGREDSTTPDNDSPIDTPSTTSSADSPDAGSPTSAQDRMIAWVREAEKEKMEKSRVKRSGAMDFDSDEDGNKSRLVAIWAPDSVMTTASDTFLRSDEVRPARRKHKGFTCVACQSNMGPKAQTMWSDALEGYTCKSCYWKLADRNPPLTLDPGDPSIKCELCGYILGTKRLRCRHPETKQLICRSCNYKYKKWVKERSDTEEATSSDVGEKEATSVSAT